MECPKCNNEIPDNLSFCNYCEDEIPDIDSNNESVSYVPLITRLTATLFDFAIIFFILMLIFIFLSPEDYKHFSYDNILWHNKSLLFIIYPLIFLFYFITLLYSRSATIGMRIFHLKISVENKSIDDVTPYLIRTSLLLLLTLFLFIITYTLTREKYYLDSTILDYLDRYYPIYLLFLASIPYTIIYVVKYIKSLKNKTEIYFPHDKWSKTKIVSSR